MDRHGVEPPGDRRPRVRNTGPGPGAGYDRDPERAGMLNARIAIVATIVVGQLWGLTVALNRFFENRSTALLVGFEALSFAVALAVWLVAPGEH
ncbi:MAG TPA: hypothetical protein VFC04_07395 [Actinomycetota bacterium]|nr:hypothetical protein [Actinomycetota bacterium]